MKERRKGLFLLKCERGKEDEKEEKEILINP